MNITKQIQKAIQDNEYFAFSFSAGVQREKFRGLANKFLSAKTYGESERFARRLMNFVLYQHEKDCVVGPVLESLNNFELYGEYDYRQQRLHFNHLANVFLLGLYLYHNAPGIKHAIDHEMELTTSEQEVIVDDVSRNWRYSGGQNGYGEFLYRWRLASLSHDLGYGISLSGNDKTKIKEYLEEISTFLITDIESLEDLWHFEGKDLRNQLDSSIPEISIENYMMYQYGNPFKSSVYYDHGLISSLIFLRLINEEYARHRYNPISYVGSTRIIWHESFLTGSILQAAVAIALHNLNQHEEALRKAAKETHIFDLKKRPLSWLLKVSDTLQEWDKPMADEDIMAKDLKSTDIQISLSNDRIVVKNFPKGKLDKAKGIIEHYTNPPNLIKFE